jgi:hypothetical protein
VSGSAGDSAAGSPAAGSGAAGSTVAGSGGSGAGGAGTSGTGAAGSDTTGVRDPNGPCRDLELFCFDPFDMFIFNPECFTCNNGMGCQACEFFQAI